MKSFISPLKYSRGFSLVELLVVIAIISMLATLLFPSIQTGIQKAKGTQCLSNLRQIGVSVQQYVADPDNGNQFPPIYNTGTTNAAVGSFTTNAGTSSLQPLQCLGNYGVTMALLTCPSDKDPSTSYGSYLWSPVLQEEHPQDVHIYTSGGVFTISKLSRMTVCTDKGMPHRGKLNVLRADGHVETKP
jgi:prepilin-type N-terminal cleavage/methylation domain-containing protein/prepilin-type processing-associated H-X9-DG protein